MVRHSGAFRKNCGRKRSFDFAEIVCVDVSSMRLFFGSCFASDAVGNPSIFCQVCFIGRINNHLAGVPVFFTKCSFVVAVACNHARHTLTLHFHINGHLVKSRGDHWVFSNHFCINRGCRMRLPCPPLSNIPDSPWVIFYMRLHQRIIPHLVTVIGFDALAEFLHHSTI